MVGVFNIVLSGFDLTWEGGGSAGTACGRNSLALPVTSLVVGVVALWGASRVVSTSKPRCFLGFVAQAQY